MNFKLIEYNVVPNISERNTFCIQLVDDYVLYNNQKIIGNEKIDKIKTVFEQYRAEITKLNGEHICNYKVVVNKC